MAEFEVVLSSLTDSATSIRAKCDDFRNAANEFKSATDTLTGNGDWDSDAAQMFDANVTEANKWLNTMSDLINEFAAALDTARETYQTADETGAKQFK